MRHFKVVALLLVLCSFMAFGNGSQETVEQTVEKQVLRVQFVGDWKMQDVSDPVSGRVQKGIAEFEKLFEASHPHIDLEFVLMGWGKYNEKTRIMIQANECDVFQAPGIASLAAQGLLENLAPYIERDGFDVNKYIDGQIDGWKSMGPNDTELGIYGLPMFGDPRVISYDKKIFDEWGVEYLSKKPTMDEIREKAAKMTGINPVTGEQNYGLFYRGGGHAADTLVNLVEGLGGQWGTGFKWSEMKTEFDSPEFVAALNWMRETLPYTPPGMVSQQGGEAWASDENVIGIKLYCSSGDIKKLRDNGVMDRFGVSYGFLHPTLKKGYMFAGSPVVMSANCQNKDIAWEYIKWTSSDEFGNFFYDNGFQFPVIKSAVEWDSVKAIPQMDLAIESMASLWTPRYPYRAAQPRYILGEHVEKFLLGELDAKEASSLAQSKTEAWLKDQ